MLRFFAYCLLVGLFLCPVSSHAENDVKPPAKDAKVDGDLSATQKRLDALIKAAIANDVVTTVKVPKQNKVEKPKAGSGDIDKIQHSAVVKKSANTCVAKEIFEFPEQVFVKDYQSLVMLKNKILVGSNEVDKHQVRLLVLAYIGLGFGEEAQGYAAYLEGAERDVLVAMGRSVMGVVRGGDVHALSAQSECNELSVLWSNFAKIQYSEDKKDTAHDNKIVLTPKQIAQMKALPKTLKMIMAKRFGIHAVYHDAMNTASDLMKIVIGKKKEHAAVLDDEGQFFKAQFFLHNEDKRAYPILKALAQKDGPMQVLALRDLNARQTEIGAMSYPDFEEDLEGAAHIFSQHPEGKIALVEKINYLVAKDKIDQAIGMTKEKFSIEEDFYTASVLRVSQRMQVHLTGENEKLKLHALNALLREQIFFNALADGFPLRRDGVSASLDLGLSELTPRILPVEQWSRLELHVLQELALSLPDDMKASLPKKAFSGAAYETEKMKDAFDRRRPKEAMALLRGMEDSANAVKVAADKSWENGYWALAKTTHETISNIQEKSGQPIQASLSSKTNLASALSVPSPYLLGRGNVAGNERELKALQTFLDEDIKIIKDYVNHE